jgi:hypothetical protein
LNRNAPDTGIDFAGYPANPKAGYRIFGRILCSTLKCLLKCGINNETRFHESFLLSFLLVPVPKQYDVFTDKINFG